MKLNILILHVNDVTITFELMEIVKWMNWQINGVQQKNTVLNLSTLSSNFVSNSLPSFFPFYPGFLDHPNFPYKGKVIFLLLFQLFLCLFTFLFLKSISFFTWGCTNLTIIVLWSMWLPIWQRYMINFLTVRINISNSICYTWLGYHKKVN